MFYQDFNEQFEGYTQQYWLLFVLTKVVLSGFQWTIWKDIHNVVIMQIYLHFVVLSGFQWTIWRIYTTNQSNLRRFKWLFYQDFNEQFEGYTQQFTTKCGFWWSCFIRISMNNLKDIHNWQPSLLLLERVVLSGFQWTIWRIYTTCSAILCAFFLLFYQDFNEQFEGYTQLMLQGEKQ